MKHFVDISLNKNLLMFITSSIYIIGISAGFWGHPIITAIIITILFMTIVRINITKLKYLFVWLIIFYIGLFSSIFRIKDVDLLYNIAPVDGTISGKIISIPNNSTETSSKFFFRVNKIEYENKIIENLNEKVFVTLKSENPLELENLKVTNCYSLTGSLRRPFKASNPSQFDYGKYLRNFNTHTVFYGTGDNVIKIESEQTRYEKFTKNLNDLRSKILSLHAKKLKSPNLELLGGIVFGDDAVAPPDYIKNSFVNSGLLHILAASGMNVAFIYGFWFIISGWLKLPYKFRIAGGIPLIIIYALMTGLGASVVRATIMIIFVLIGKLIDRDTHSIALLSLVAFLMLLFRPTYLNDVGFQLSFIVTFGILITSPLIIKFGEEGQKLSLKDNMLNFISGTIFIPIIAQIWVLPIQMFYFNTISLYSVFANIMTVPFLSIISFGGFISSILAPIKFIGVYICSFFDIILNPLLSIVINISNLFAALPNSLVITPHPNLFQLICYYLGILSVIYLIKNRHFTKITTILTLSFFVIFLMTFINIPNHKLEIIFFDVQNADCALIKTPKNRFFMIDTGKSGYDKGKSQAEFIVTKYMKDNGIKNLDFIIVTHFDNDHAGGTVDLMRYANVNKIYLNSKTSNTYTGIKIFEYLESHPEINVHYAKNNEIIYKEQGLTITNYFADLGEKQDNENSIITLINYGGQKFLFTGDAGIIALEKLKEILPSNITLLKVPHHGADKVLNKNLVNKLAPKISIVSVGKNFYGHPSPETMDLIKDSKIMRTDLQNSIKISSDKKSTRVYKWDMKLKKYIRQ